MISRVSSPSPAAIDSTSLLRIAAKTATQRRPPISSRAAATIAAIPAGLWAPSMRIGGSPSIQSMRPRQRTVSHPATTAVAGMAIPPALSVSQIATAVAMLATWNVPRRGARTEIGRPSNTVSTATPQQTLRMPGEADVGADHGERRADLRRARPDRGEPGLDGPGHRLVAGLDDRRLLARDLRDRLAEEILVVERDVGHRCDAEIEHVGAVEAAAEADLADEHLRIRLARGEDARGGEHLEPGRLQLVGQGLGGLPDASDQCPELGLGEGCTVANDPFAVRDQVRAGQQHGAMAGGAADGIDGGAHRALAVRARDQRAAEPDVRVAERRKQRSSAFEPWHDAAPRDRVEGRHGAGVGGRGHAQCQASFIASPGSGRVTSRRSAPIQARRRSPASSTPSIARSRKRPPV